MSWAFILATPWLSCPLHLPVSAHSPSAWLCFLGPTGHLGGAFCLSLPISLLRKPCRIACQCVSDGRAWRRPGRKPSTCPSSSSPALTTSVSLHCDCLSSSSLCPLVPRGLALTPKVKRRREERKSTGSRVDRCSEPGRCFSGPLTRSTPRSVGSARTLVLKTGLSSSAVTVLGNNLSVM